VLDKEILCGISIVSILVKSNPAKTFLSFIIKTKPSISGTNNMNQLMRKLKYGLYRRPEAGALLALIIMCVVLAIISEYFLKATNLLNIAKQASVLAIVGVGLTYIIISSGIDLSVGSIASLSGVLLAGSIVYFEGWLGILLGIIVGLSSGFAIGIINGFFVTKLRIPPIIATLGMMIAVQGISLTYTLGSPISLGFKFLYLGRGSVGPIPALVVLMIFIYLAAFFFLTQTSIGLNTYALGGNEEAVRVSGVNVEKIRIILYGLCGCTAGIAGIVLASRLGAGQPVAGEALALDSIAAVAIGGCNIYGGEGSLVGTLVGAFIITVINNGLTLMNVNIYSQYIVKGMVLVFAVAIRSRERR
jgi:ribose transport system permease protein